MLPSGKARLSCQEKDEEALTRGRERKEAAQRQEAACTPVARGGAGIRPGGVRPSWGEGGCDLTVFLLGTHHSVTWRPLALLHAGCAGPLFQPTCTCCEGPRASLSCLLWAGVGAAGLGGICDWQQEKIQQRCEWGARWGLPWSGKASWRGGHRWVLGKGEGKLTRVVSGAGRARVRQREGGLPGAESPGGFEPFWSLMMGGAVAELNAEGVGGYASNLGWTQGLLPVLPLCFCFLLSPVSIPAEGCPALGSDSSCFPRWPRPGRLGPVFLSDPDGCVQLTALFACLIWNGMQHVFVRVCGYF